MSKDFKEKTAEKLCSIEDDMDCIRDALDDIRNTTENIYDDLNDTIDAYNDAVEDIVKIQKRFAIAMFVTSFLVSFGIGLALNGRRLIKFIKKLR